MTPAKYLNSIVTAATAWVLERKITLMVWTVVVVGIVVAVQIDHSHHAAEIARLSSSDLSVCDSEVADLVSSGRLSSVLLSTEDPAGDPDDAQNRRSAIIRAKAGDSLVRLAPKLPADPALAALYGLEKDKVTAADAVTGLSELGVENAHNLHVLVAGLGDGDPDVRTASVAALSKIGGTSTAALVASMVKVDGAQDSALATLSALGKPAVPYVVQLLTDKSSSEPLRESAAAVLGRIGDPCAAPALEAAATQVPPSPQLRRVCLTSLATIVLTTIPPSGTLAASTAAPNSASIASAAEEAPILIESLLNDGDDSFARSKEALALGRLSSDQAIAALARSLGSLDLRIAAAAQTGLEYAGEKAVPALTQSIHSPNSSVRIAAASALGVIGTDDSIRSLQPALSDVSPLVRRSAVQGLGRGMNSTAIPQLIASLNDSDGSVASAASHSLYELGAPAVAPLIAVLGSSGASNTRAFFASLALEDDGDVAVPQLTAASTSGSALQRIWIANTLGGIRDPDSIPVLDRMANSKDANVKWAAQTALDQFEGES